MTRPRNFDLTDVEDGTPGDDIESYPPEFEVGRTGLRRVSGYVNDEFLPQLSGTKANQVFREMADNSAIAAAWIYTVTQLLRQIEWRVEPASNQTADRANAEFVEQNMADMEHSFGDFIGEVCSFLTFGWSVHEMVYKRREGLWAKNPNNRSEFNDGRVGWRKLPIRGQESLLRWVFAENGDVLAMVQMPAPRYQKIVLPMGKCLHFRTRLNKSNPQGYSLLRPMYRSWFQLKRFEEIEMVGVERDLTGLPVAKVPPKYLNAKPGTLEAKTLAAVQAAVRATRRNEQEGLVWPLDYDEDTKTPLWDFSLLTSGGSRQFDIGGVIQRLETRMLMSAMADFIMTGHEDSGASYALHTDKSGIFETGVNGLALAIADPFNRKAIPDLFRLNGMRPERLPKLVPNNVNPPDLTQLASFMSALAGTGVQWFPDPELEKFVRDAARLPKLDRDIEQVHETEQRQAAILGLAQQQLQLLQVEQQAQQGQVQAQQGQLQLQSQAMNNQQQAAAMQAPPEQGDPNEQTRSDLATQADAVKLQQEKAKLANLRKPAGPRSGGKRQPVGKALSAGRPTPRHCRPSSGKRQPVGKALSAFGVEHEEGAR